MAEITPKPETTTGAGHGPVIALAHRLDDALRRVTEAMSSIGTVWFFALVILICAEVIAREFFLAPIRGVTELAAYSIVGATFLQLSNSLYSERMTRADFLLSIFGKWFPAGLAVLEVIISLIGLWAMIILTQAAWPKLVETYVEAEIVGIPGEFSFQVWPLRLLVVLGSAMTALAFFARALRRIGAVNAQHGKAGLVAVAVTLVALVSLWYAVFPAVMDAGLSNFAIGAMMLAVLFVVVLMGVHIGITMMLIGFLGLWLLKGRIAFGYSMLGLAGNEFLANYYFSAVPLFVLMGLLVAAADIGRETFAVASWLTRPIRGGLGIATVGANALFAAITGSSVASATVFAKVATPEMIRHGYNRKFSVGVVAGSSVLGMLIPPSLLLIVYGFLAEQSVGFLFTAAIIPGVILAMAMSGLIWFSATFRPETVFDTHPDAGDVEEFEGIGKAAMYLAPILGLIALVLGGIYGGLFTPTEGGAVGAAGALLYALARGRLPLGTLWRVMVETGQIATTVLFLILAANIFTIMLASSGFVQNISGIINGLNLNLFQFAVCYVLLLVILGMFLESVSIMLIIVPIALPTALALGGDAIWFGILTVIAVEIGLLTPPFGLSCYVVAATLRDMGVQLVDIFRGVMPFVLVMFLVTLLLIVFPVLGSVTLQ
ncbi:TRAP transporter large permease subunit [Microbulbifer sp. S227A]|uniref:TRAP transporter large permease n=1 Tax=Microbulbifer sp. S227A TaxID=3415131 RepID=UPI003C7E6AD2